MPEGKKTSRARPSQSNPRPAAAPRPIDTRAKILKAALTEFADQGFHGARTREIAATAGVNQGLITYHFASKEALWQAAVESLFGELRNELGRRAAALEDIDPAARLRALIKHFVRFSAGHPELHRLMVEEGRRDSPRLEWLVRHHVKPLYELSRTLIEAAQAQGIAPAIDPVHLHYILIGAGAHLFMVGPECRLVSGRDPSDKAMIEAHAEAVVSFLLGTNAGVTARHRPGRGV